MRYERYGVMVVADARESRGPESGDGGERRAMGDEPDACPPRIVVPRGLSLGEAAFLLDVFARLKARRFGRLEVTVSDGRLMDVELVERLDRKLFRTF
jgi:hypothetical protein